LLQLQLQLHIPAATVRSINAELSVQVYSLGGDNDYFGV